MSWVWCSYIYSHFHKKDDDVIMGAIASLITSLTSVYSIVYSDADQRKHQSSTSLAFVRGIHRGPVNSPHKWPATRKMFPINDVIMLLGLKISDFGWKKGVIFQNPRKGGVFQTCVRALYTLCSGVGAGSQAHTHAITSLQLHALNRHWTSSGLSHLL